MIDNYKLPKNWEIKSLGDIGSVSMCKRIFKEQTQPKGDIPFYKIGTFGKVADAYISKTIFDEYKQNYSFPNKGDILLSAAGTIGKAVIYDGEQAYFQDSNIVWIDNDEKQVLNKYLFFYYLIQPWRPTSGSIVTRLYNDDILNTDIPFPSLEEQDRIVKIIETKLSAVDKIKTANVEQVVTCDLLKNKLYEKIFKEYQDELVTIDSICNDISDGTHFTPNYVTHGIPFLSVKDLTKGYISFDDCRYIDIEEHQKLIKRCNPQYGDVLYTKVGTTGIAKAIDVEKDFSIFVSVALLKLKDKISSSFVEKSLNLPFCRKQAEKLTQGATNKNLVIKDLKTIKLFCPEYSEQLKIVKTLEKIDNSLKKFNMSLNEQSTYIKALPSSILRKAFNGDY